MPAPESGERRPERRPVHELVVISGKGGTGKTSLVASFCDLAENAALADCDVDAADLHLVLEPTILEQHVFSSGCQAVVREDECDGCSMCAAVCRFGAVAFDGFTAQIDPFACEGCGLCAEVCPLRAIDLVEPRCGEWYVSATRTGDLVHARLDIAAEIPSLGELCEGAPLDDPAGTAERVVVNMLEEAIPKRADLCVCGAGFDGAVCRVYIAGSSGPSGNPDRDVRAKG